MVEKGELLLYGIGDRSWCEFYANTGDAPEEVFEWWDDVCQGVELSDDLPRYCPFDEFACENVRYTIGLRATTDIPAGTRFTPAVVEMVYIPSEAYAGQAQRAWTLGALARTGIPAGEILLQIMLCAYEVGCPELPEVEASGPDCDELRGSAPNTWPKGTWQGFAAACFSCDNESEFSIEPEEREWYERSCSSQEPAPPSEPSASSGERDHLLASARLGSLPAHHGASRRFRAATP